ncbi:CPSF A subunit region protein [Metarhizium robertsii]|uniref:Uncharacterized protein n=2 Tax=Metarhizium robertsii TaxID=568076 RepID=E9EXE5_METRA|nr:uncharacterized protein MAA_04694 [Metarhizium robertsii ARSEF 23]EFY99765.1 hypothetical protein MAA_04694 [Metarhizium robertsii ARSEF 23]EXV06453.1 CPSF A subunit region protein [Metarhizium robertsii]
MSLVSSDPSLRFASLVAQRTTSSLLPIRAGSPLSSQYLATDPKGRACLIASIEKNNLIHVLDRNAEADLTISSPLGARKHGILDFSVVSLDVGYALHNQQCILALSTTLWIAHMNPVMGGFLVTPLSYHEHGHGISQANSARKASLESTGVVSNPSIHPQDQGRRATYGTPVLSRPTARWNRQILSIYNVGMRQLLRRAQIYISPQHTVPLQSPGFRIVVGDLQHGMTMVVYNRVSNKPVAPLTGFN